MAQTPDKTFGYHPARAYGNDVWTSKMLKNVNVEIEYDSQGMVIGIFIRERKDAE